MLAQPVDLWITDPTDTGLEAGISATYLSEISFENVLMLKSDTTMPKFCEIGFYLSVLT